MMAPYKDLHMYHSSYRGFLVMLEPGALRWRAWREDGAKFRADTLAGLKAGIRELIAGE